MTNNLGIPASRRGAIPAPNAPAPPAPPAAAPAMQAPAGPAPATPAPANVVGNADGPAEDERLYREFTVTTRRYFPFEGGYEEKTTIITTRTYLDNPVGGEYQFFFFILAAVDDAEPHFPEPPLVIQTTTQIVTTVLREELHGPLPGGDDDDDDNGSTTDTTDAGRSGGSDLDSDVEMLAPVHQAPASRARISMNAPAHQAPAGQAHVDMNVPAHQAPARKARIIVINTDSDDPDGKAKAAALRASAPYPMFREYPDAPSENVAQPAANSNPHAFVDPASLSPAARNSAKADRFRVIDSFFQKKVPGSSTAATSSADPASVAGPSHAASTSRTAFSSAATKIRPRQTGFIGPKKKPIITDFEIDENGAIVISDSE